jgi:hypothetical protein
MELKTNLDTKNSAHKKLVTRTSTNKAFIITLTLITVLLNSRLYSAPGCMDNSRHLTQLNDNKEYHFVRCSCPCNKRIAHQNRCIDCRHAHNPEPVEILSNAQPITSAQAKQYKKYERYFESPEKTLNLRLQAMLQKRKSGTTQ